MLNDTPRNTPRSQRVRIAGKLDTVRHRDCTFVLVLESGEPIPCVLADGEPEVLAMRFGKVTVVSGTARFGLSGALLRVDADLLQPGTDEDLAMWCETPRPLFDVADVRDLRRPQGPRTGINAIIGAWPGDETDDEVFEMLEEMS
jgi:hypothetical protein